MSETLETATDVASFLSSEIKRTKFPDGTVITFDRIVDIKPAPRMRRRMMDFDDEDDEEYEPKEGELLATQKMFSYAALFVNKRWYFTGAGTLGKSKLKSREFLEMLVEQDITNVKVASAFADVN